MDTIKSINAWLDSRHPPAGMDFIRILLGIFIVYKGVQFTSNFQQFTADIESIGWAFIAAHAAQYILFIHFVGGLLIVMGAFTRAMCLLNLPILAGAVVFNSQKYFTMQNMELPVAAIVLALLIIFFIYGSGRISVDELRRKGKEAEAAVNP
jgi:uncharacterized membrane protein YphA (DoxX/SURF4 family)